MKRTINSTEKGKDVGISPAEETPIPGFPTDYEQRVRERLSRTPFASLVNALRSGTRQDQLSCMLQVERRLLQYRQVLRYVVDTHAVNFLKRCNRCQGCLDKRSALR